MYTQLTPIRVIAPTRFFRSHSIGRFFAYNIEAATSLRESRIKLSFMMHNPEKMTRATSTLIRYKIHDARFAWYY